MSRAGDAGVVVADGLLALAGELGVVEVEPGLDDYYRENVIGGLDAFTVVAQDLTSFADAVMRKLLIEVASAPRSGGRSAS